MCTAPESPWASRKRNRSSSRQEEAGNRNGLVGISRESWPGTLHREANSVFRKRWRFLGGRGGRLLRSLGKVELGEVTSRKKKGGHSSVCGFRADQEEGLLSGRAGPRRSRGMGFRYSKQHGFGQATKHSQVSAGLSGKWGSVASLEVPC